MTKPRAIVLERPHPWLVADSGDDTDDTGDPRDMTVPSVPSRYEFAVRDADAWARLCGSTDCPRHPRIGPAPNPNIARCQQRNRCRRCARMISVRGASQWCREVEMLVRTHPEKTLEWHFADRAYLERVERWIVTRHWIYGERFWAWWQGRQPEAKRITTKSEDTYSSAPDDDHGPSYADHAAGIQRITEALIAGRPTGLQPFGIADPDPRPVLRLADGSEVRADEVYEWTGAPATYDQRAYVAGRPLARFAENRRWHETPGLRERLAPERWRRVYPLAEAKPVQYIDIPSGVPEALCEGELVPPALRGPDGNVLPFRQLWRRPNGSGVALQTDEAPPAAFVEGMTCVWPPPRHRKAPADAKPDPTAAYLTPGDQIRTHTGWHTVADVSHPAYPHVTCEGNRHWFRGAILETRKAADVPRAAVNAHGVDACQRPEIREGDFVRWRRPAADMFSQPGPLGLWARVLGRAADGDALRVRHENGDDQWSIRGIAEHRPAPRIVLPDGREVVPERMYRDPPGVDGGTYANINGDGWQNLDADPGWTLAYPGEPWEDDPGHPDERTWPPLDVEPA